MQRGRGQKPRPRNPQQARTWEPDFGAAAVTQNKNPTQSFRGVACYGDLDKQGIETGSRWLYREHSGSVISLRELAIQAVEP